LNTKKLLKFINIYFLSHYGYNWPNSIYNRYEFLEGDGAQGEERAQGKQRSPGTYDWNGVVVRLNGKKHGSIESISKQAKDLGSTDEECISF
jgi:phospholipase C